jgi:hypothetical protein
MQSPIVKQWDLQEVMQVKKRKYNLQQKDRSMPSIKMDKSSQLHSNEGQRGLMIALTHC